MSDVDDYLQTVERQLAQLTERGGFAARRRTDVLALGSAVLVTVAVVAVLLTAGTGANHVAAGTHGSLPAGHSRRPAAQRGGASGSRLASGHRATIAPASVSGASPPAGPVPTRFSPESFTAVSDQTWWLLGSAPCSSPPCTSIVRTEDAGRSFVGTPAPRTDQVSQLRFANVQDGFAYGPQLWVTHDAGADWHRVELGGAVTELAIAGGNAYAIVRSGSVGRLWRSPVGLDQWTAFAGAGDAYGGLWAHGSDVVLESASQPGIGDELMLSRNSGATFTRYTVPSSITCAFEEPAAPVVWAHCATGTLSSVWRSTDYGRTLRPAAGGQPPGGPQWANSAAFAAASASTAVVGDRQLYRTTDGGSSYIRMANPKGVTSWSYLGFTDATHGVALGYVGADTPSRQRLYYTTDGGVSYDLVLFR